MSARRAVDLTGAERWAIPGPLTLGDDDVHVWNAVLDRSSLPAGVLAQWLTPDERQRGDRLRFDIDRRRFVVARATLRWLLASYLGTEPGRVRFDYGARGKPELAKRPHDQPLRFNCSHSHGHAIYAITAGRRIGVDLEVIRPVPEAQLIASRWFSLRQRAALAAAPASKRDEMFLRTWTDKEAHAKAVGVGLIEGFPGVEAPWRLDGPPAGASPVPTTTWSARALNPAPGCVATLVVEGYQYRLRCETLTGPAHGPT